MRVPIVCVSVLTRPPSPASSSSLSAAVHVLVRFLAQRSEVTLLRGYGPDVPVELIERLCRAFAELRAMNDAGAIAYPYSTRELVNVVVHVQACVLIVSPWPTLTALFARLCQRLGEHSN